MVQPARDRLRRPNVVLPCKCSQGRRGLPSVGPRIRVVRAACFRGRGLTGAARSRILASKQTLEEPEMFRRRTIVMAGLLALVIPIALNAQAVPWIADVEKGMADAKRVGLPVLFYLDTAGADVQESGDEYEQSFTDQRVGAVVRGRFVPVRLRKSQITETMLEQMEAKDAAPYSIVVATPTGHLVGTIPAGQVAKPDALADQLMAMFRKYGTSVFERDLKPVLEDLSAKTDQMIKSLELIDRLLIAEADLSVVQLLDREQLPDDVRKRAYQTLAALSTKRSAQALLAAALHDEAAAAALSNCTPDAAETLLPDLDPAKPDVANLVYSAVTRICELDAVRPELFIEDAPEEAQRQEIERVKRAVTQAAHRWREEHKGVR